MLKFNRIEISSKQRPKIIAEIGINHGGSLDSAKKMAELAIESGADIVKTQLHIAEAEMSSSEHAPTPTCCKST